MTTYNLIIKKLLNTDNNIFSSNYDKTDITDENCKLFFNIFLNNEINTKNKFKFFYENLNNILLKNKNKFIDYFCKIQKTYNVLNKFIYIYKFNKAKIVVNMDMALNEIKINQKNVLCVFDGNAKYLFLANDIINIIDTALTNNFSFFAQPVCVKNPYNNLPFLKSTLYNMYLFIKFNTYLVPPLFFYFFYCNFNLSYFTYKYEYLLREASIQNYVFKSPSNILIKETKKMIEEYNDYCKKNFKNNIIVIDKDFPQNKLIKIMRPYLLIYFNSNYSLLPYKKIEMRNMLRMLLLKFNKYNPQFGRKKYKILMGYNKNDKKCIVGKIIEFNDKHISFNNKKFQNNSFLTDHLVCKQMIYYDYNEINNINIPHSHFVFNDEEYYNEEEEEEVQVEYNIEEEEEHQEVEYNIEEEEEDQNDEDLIS